MGISVADNFSYLGGKPLDGRIQYATLAAMKAMADATLYEGCEAYCIETDKYYKWKSSNTVDASTGKWREIEGGGQTYNDFTGATASTAGAHGLVPAPSAGDEGKVLFGNGAWGALPSVDLSVLSNEAFIFGNVEKAVGQNTDGKLIYQKTITGLNISLTWNYEYYAYAYIDKLVQNVEKIVGVSFYSDAGVCINGDIKQESTRWQVVTDEVTWNINEITVRYTKTTDSPLPSDEKFAGLLSNGTVVYKKTVSTGGSAPSGTTLIYRLALLNSTDVVYFTR